jgi:hypothetical protein
MAWAGFWIGFGIMCGGLFIGLGLESLGGCIYRAVRDPPKKDGGYR